MTLTLLSFSAVLAWLALLLFRGGFWRCEQQLSAAPAPETWPEVVAIVPARNEAETIEKVIQSHAASDYPGDFSTILVDDQSDDATAALAEAASASHNLTVIPGEALPSGWTGKLWAMQQGADAAAMHAPDAKFILFTDADIVQSPEALRLLVAKAEASRLDLVSLMARLDMRGLWGGLLIPAFVYFFQKLYPFRWVNDPDHPAAAAAGGVMLVRRDTLERSGGLAAIRGTLIDDCALARLIKNTNSGKRIWLGLACDEAVSIRDNRGLGSIWKMVTRTAYTQLRHSLLLLVFTIAVMFYLYLSAPLIALSFAAHGNLAALFFALCAWGLIGFSYIPTLKFYGHPLWQALTLPLAGLIYLIMTIDSARQHWRGHGGLWKGRHYS